MDKGRVATVHREVPVAALQLWVDELQLLGPFMIDRHHGGLQLPCVIFQALHKDSWYPDNATSITLYSALFSSHCDSVISLESAVSIVRQVDDVAFIF